MKSSAFLAIALFSALTSHATQFHLSYHFPDEMRMEACFEGDIDGNLIRNVTHVDMWVTGSWFIDGHIALTLDQSFAYGGYGLQDGGAVMSLDGCVRNFRFSSENKVDEGDDWYDQNVVWFGHTPTNSFSLYWYVAGDNYVFEAERWKLSYGGTAVPDGGPGLLLVVATMIALDCGRRTKRTF